jgi:hypothetical protein
MRVHLPDIEDALRGAPVNDRDTTLLANLVDRINVARSLAQPAVTLTTMEMSAVWKAALIAIMDTARRDEGGAEQGGRDGV